MCDLYKPRLCFCLSQVFFLNRKTSFPDNSNQNDQRIVAFFMHRNESSSSPFMFFYCPLLHLFQLSDILLWVGWSQYSIRSWTMFGHYDIAPLGVSAQVWEGHFFPFPLPAMLLMAPEGSPTLLRNFCDGIKSFAQGWEGKSLLQGPNFPAQNHKILPLMFHIISKHEICFCIMYWWVHIQGKG